MRVRSTGLALALGALAALGALGSSGVGAANRGASAAGSAPSVYVSSSGSDSAPGTRRRPFRTIQHAVNVVPSGGLVLVQGGTYRGFEVRRDRITVAGLPGAVVRVQGGGADVVEFANVRGGGLRRVRVTGSNVQYGSAIKVTGSQAVSVRNVVAQGSRTFGIVVVDSGRVQIRGSDIFGNASGIEERRARNLLISGNRIHNNLKPVDSGRGSEGITFYKSNDPVRVIGNGFWRNRTHLEVYGASRLMIRANRFRGGEVMETGTDGPPCGGNRFVRNIAVRGSVSADGLILRCARNMIVAHNVLDGFDDFALYIVNGLKGVAYGGSIAGLRVEDNIIVGGRAYSLGRALPPSVILDYNLLNHGGSAAAYGQYAAYVEGRGNADTLREFRRWTGYERHGVAGPPRFVRPGANFHLRSGSPAIDAGIKVLGDSYRGAAPDIGRYETR